ncbi:hypothetical protein I546_2097 [Mycobacterium kansasii 732]|uniref:HicB-like antitoxin of toxin-antitoxin system domain-containing protein n=1 Tax=Mycobacterium pseudokansasii TaxID=2341080 RepID=A0A498QZ18_9MYCO|nr:hypothetical protein [Mycobacterium pseudokansasii]EUA13233.1 hypothetical protein I546_2097 [Mycobacterium kansasii 732]KZS60181.1 hypothetical protein A4G27_06390 [Mycobacterium kansasii]MBY0390938.1 hypothetical protein [Mycobacterium pseudokansasii]VAZ99257.1 hypothetical protein LAUMK35_04257 [Mycobacterium pseudokansasii]VBA30399.1 hypothetical protein LAUMK21_04252 [Mycobacterium pseudokansasii]
MVHRYSYRVVWSPGHDKYAAHCNEIPVVSSLASTPQEALDQLVRLVADGEDATDGPVASAIPEGLAATGELPAGSRLSLHRPRVVPRWRTRC